MDPITLAAAKSYTDESLQDVEVIKGEDGFSPTIIESPNNTEEVYQLDITNKSGRFRTPNLKGITDIIQFETEQINFLSEWNLETFDNVNNG